MGKGFTVSSASFSLFSIVSTNQSGYNNKERTFRMTLSSALRTCFWDIFLLLDCLVQPWCECLCLALLHLVMLCLVSIPGRPALFWMEMEEEWIWGKAEVGVDWEDWKLQSGCHVWEKKERERGRGRERERNKPLRCHVTNTGNIRRGPQGAV